MRRRADSALLAIVGLGALLRLPGLFDDFWLDEIWSYRIARELRGPLDLLLSPVGRSDNNHPLNTLLVWLMGEQAHWWVYRLPSLFAGTGTVILAALIGARRGHLEAAVAAVLVACSYPLVVYSSEARGYGLVVCFALLAFAAVERGPVALFAAACVLGLLSHLTFVHVYTGLVAWTAYRLARSAAPRGAARRLLALHVVPATTVLLLYAVFVRHLTIGGAPERPTGEALAESLAALGGITGSTVTNPVAAVVVALAAVGLVVALRRHGRDEWIFALVALLVSPTVVIAAQVLLVNREQAIYPRHFVVLLPFLLVGLGTLAADALRQRRRRPAAVVLLASFVALNLWQTARFVRGTRGHYADAVAYIGARTPGPIVAVLSDHAARTGLVVEFYARVLPRGKQLLLIDEAQDPSSRPALPPAWVVAHGFASDPRPGPVAIDRGSGTTFRFDREFEAYGLSGYNWSVYRVDH